VGSRANYLLVEKGGSELWYSHWGAQSIVRDLFWGPELAIPFVRRQRRTDEWLDDVWCEGAALIDLEKKVLILFGGEDIHYEPPLRRVYLELLRAPWAGWEIRWAHEGLVDVAEYAGLDRATVLSGTVSDTSRAPGAAGGWIESVTSVSWEDGRIGLYPMNCGAAYQVSYGPDLVDTLRGIDHKGGFGAALSFREGPPERFVVQDLGGGGLHVDAKRKEIHFWTASSQPDLKRRAVHRWPGWSVDWHLDRFEDQAALTGQRLAFEVATDDELLRRVVETLLYEPVKDRAQRVQEIAGILSEHGKKAVTINASALIDAPQDVTKGTRRDIVRAAQASYLERRASQDP
jgi:hypothetical protein